MTRSARPSESSGSPKGADLSTWRHCAFHAVAKHIHVPSGWISDACEATLAVAAAIVLYHLIDRNVQANRNRYYAARLGWVIAGSRTRSL